MKTTHIIAFGGVRSQLCLLGCLGLGPGSFRDIFPAQRHRHRRRRRQGCERRHPRDRPLAALCRQPADSGERRSTVARGRALPHEHAVGTPCPITPTFDIQSEGIFATMGTGCANRDIVRPALRRRAPGSASGRGRPNQLFEGSSLAHHCDHRLLPDSLGPGGRL